MDAKTHQALIDLVGLGRQCIPEKCNCGTLINCKYLNKAENILVHEHNKDYEFRKQYMGTITSHEYYEQEFPCGQQNPRDLGFMTLQLNPGFVFNGTNVKALNLIEGDKLIIEEVTYKYEGIEDRYQVLLRNEATNELTRLDTRKD